MRDTWGHLSCCTLHEEYWTGVTLDTIQCNQCVQCVLIVTRTLLESFLKLGLLEPFYVLFWDTVLLYSSLGTPYLERLHWHRHPTPTASSCQRISDKEGSSSDSAGALDILYTCSSAVHWDWVHPIHFTFEEDISCLHSKQWRCLEQINVPLQNWKQSVSNDRQSSTSRVGIFVVIGILTFVCGFAHWLFLWIFLRQIGL